MKIYKWTISTEKMLDIKTIIQFSLVKPLSLSDSLRPLGLQHARAPCPSSTPRAWSNSCPSSQWCHPTISSFVIPFFTCLQSFPASGSFPGSQFFASGGQSIGVLASASVLPMNIQDWFQLVNPKGNQPWIFIEKTDPEAKAPIFWPSDVKSQLFGKDSDAGKDWRQEKGSTEGEMTR